jgi:hypothetical protein
MPGALRFFVLSIIAFALVSGCAATRSISNSGYPGDRKSQNPFYAGELGEMDVLGFTGSTEIGEEDIRQAMETARDIKLRRGSPLIVIQSGALSPDESMMDALNRYFTAVPFSGLPSGRAEDRPSYSKRLRLTAARGGYTHILCYWGTLETASKDKAGKAVSWVPAAGAFIPDEAQQMRIRLKAALIDVASGKWAMITPDPIDDSATSSGLTRIKTDQKQVSDLKEKAYATLVSELSRYFSF